MYKILISEDEPPIAHYLKSVVEAEDKRFEVVGIAEDGDSAIEAVRSLNPQVILTDIRLPMKSGLDVLETLRAEGCNIHAIIVTGYRDFDYAQRALKLGAVDYLLKPVKVDDLLGVLDTIADRLRTNSTEELSSLSQKDEAELLVSLLTGDVASIENYFNLLWGRWKNKIISRDAEKRAVLYLFDRCVRSLGMEKEEWSAQIRSGILALYDSNASSESPTIISSHFTRLLDANRRALSTKKGLIENIDTFLDQNIGQVLTVGKVASYFRVSPSYLSKLYKQETGTTLIKRISKKKIAKAMELIKYQPDIMIKDAARMVGYDDEFYFSKVFKSQTGVWPSEFSLALRKEL